MVTPWVPVPSLSDDAYRELRMRAIFECDKWDPQVGDQSVVARHPLVIRAEAWDEVCRLAEALAGETAAAEAELLHEPQLHRALGLPRSVRRALGRVAAVGAPTGAARIIRFDFHYTTGGWRISEANTDVPGGLNEASGFARVIAPHYAWAAPAGDAAGAYCDELLAAAGRPTPVIALVHATAYSDDLQMMAFLARRLAAMGAETHLVSPAHVHWHEGVARLDTAWYRGPVDLIVRFFPSEWLPQLESKTGWPWFFAGGRTPMANPASAILTQSKRLPLVWDALQTPMPVWRALLPASADPRRADWRRDPAWILKPVLGRVGEGIGIAGVIDRKDWKRIRRSASWWPSQWLAQRRFEVVPLNTAGGVVYPCLGVYTVNGRTVGAYGRIAARPLVDSRAEDAAVLVAA